MSFRDYSTAPSANTELGDGTYIGPNMLRNKVRPALQQIAADGKELADEITDGFAMANAIIDAKVLTVTSASGQTVTTRNLLAGIVAPVAGQTAYLAETGREGWFRFSTTSHAALVTIDTNQGLYVAPSTDTTGASGAWVRLFSGPMSVKWFGATGDGATNDSAAFTAALTLIENGKLHVPEGSYRIGSMISIKYQIHLDGDGGIDTYGTRFLVDAGVTAFRVLHSSDAGMTAGQDGSYSIISNIFFQAAGKAAAAYAIHISAHQVKVSNCGFVGFKSHNIAIVATAPVGNANNCIIENCRSISSDGSGLFFDGADSNACTVINFDGSSNARYAIEGSDFLGNSWISCHSAGNTLGAYKTDDTNSRTMVLGCYSESGQPQAVFASKTSVVGGLHAAGISGGALMLADGAAHQGAFQGVTLQGGVNYQQFQIGDPSTAESLVLFGNTTTASPAWRLKCSTANIVYFDYNNGGSSVPLIMYPGTTAPGINLPRGLRATLPTYADNTAALAGGLVATDAYKTAAGDWRIVV